MPLKLYKRNGIFYYSGTIGPRGRRKRFRDCSCYTSDKEIAARQVAEVEAGYWKGHFDGPGAVLTFDHACSLYEAAGKKDFALAKVRAYLKQTLIKDITESTVQIMAKALYPNATGASLNRMVIVPTLAVINHCARSNMCQSLKVQRYPVEAKIKEPATLEWVKAFAAHAGPHAGALVWFMFLTGARIGEALRLRWEDVNLAERTAVINQSKVDAQRIAHLPQPLVVALANLERIPGRPVFGYQSRGAVKNAWRWAVKRAGIKPLSPHCCRHGFATGLLRRGIDVMTVAKLGGWASAAQVLQTYGHAIQRRDLTEVLLDAELTQGPAIVSDNDTKTGTYGE